MRFPRLCALLVASVSFLLLVSCSDTTDVGLGVGPDPLEGGEPVTLDIVPEVDTTVRSPQTGRDVTPDLSGSVPNWRILVGRVDDPIPGTGVLRADGYFDVSTPDLPNRLELETTPDSIAVQLRFTTEFVHGDTSSAVNVEVRSLTEEAEMSGARADTSFAAGPLATDGPVPLSPTDSLVTIDLSDEWLTSDRLDVLQDTSQEFHGFKLFAANPTTEDAVLGLSSRTATLRLLHKGDSTTAEYPAVKVFSHIEQTAASSGVPPDGFTLLQDGTGVGLAMNWSFDESPLDSLNSDPLNRAEIKVPIDTTEMQEQYQPSSFSRPLPAGFRMIATRHPDSSTPSCSQISRFTPALSEDRRDCVVGLSPGLTGEARVPNSVAFPIFDLSFRRTRQTDNNPSQPPVFTQFRLFVADQAALNSIQSTFQPGQPSTVPVLVPVEGDTPGPPRATLTVTPL